MVLEQLANWKKKTKLYPTSLITLTSGIKDLNVKRNYKSSGRING